MKKQDILNAHPDVSQYIRGIKRKHYYVVNGYRKPWERIIFEVTHFYKTGLKVKLLTNPALEKGSVSALLYSRLTNEYKWMFTWDFIINRKLTFTEVPKEDLLLHISYYPTPYFKKFLGNEINLALVGDWKNKKDNPMRKFRSNMVKYLHKHKR